MLHFPSLAATLLEGASMAILPWLRPDDRHHIHNHHENQYYRVLAQQVFWRHSCQTWVIVSDQQKMNMWQCSVSNFKAKTCCGIILFILLYLWSSMPWPQTGNFVCLFRGCATWTKSHSGLTLHYNQKHAAVANMRNQSASEANLNNQQQLQDDFQPDAHDLEVDFANFDICNTPPPAPSSCTSPTSPPRSPALNWRHTRTYHPHLTGKWITNSKLSTFDNIGQPCGPNSEAIDPNTVPPSCNLHQSAYDWSPFDNCKQFKIVDLLFCRVEMSAPNINALFDIWGPDDNSDLGESDSEDTSSQPFHSYSDMYNCINESTLDNIPWQCMHVVPVAGLDSQTTPQSIMRSGTAILIKLFKYAVQSWLWWRVWLCAICGDWKEW